MAAGPFSRLSAVFFKEFVQMRRDRLTFAILIMMPVMQILMFGYAINTDPRHMPTVVELRETGPMTRSLLAALRTSSYFDIIDEVASPELADRMMRDGRANFLISVPEGFEEKLARGERPQILVAADATDPVAAGGALGAMNAIAQQLIAQELQGPLAHLQPAPAPFEVVLHRRYNPAGSTAENIVPGLLGIILTMTLVMITSMALTREEERGTLETLLATPVRPLEVMIGKTTPYIFVAVIQIALVLAAAHFLFRVPFEGAASALVIGLTVFVAVNLVLGFLISTAARSQMQAMQMTFFLFLPSVLLSGFMFPYAAMPVWARFIGEGLPITHFLRIVRKVMLKGAGIAEVMGDIVPLLILLCVLCVLALMRYRRTLD